VSRGYYSVGKRQRDQLKAEKKREKEARRWERRERGPSEPELVTAEDIVGELPSIDEAMQNTPLAQLESSRDRSSAPIPARP